MEHLDPDHLVFLALGDHAEHGQHDPRALSTPDDPSRTHLQDCAMCRNELVGLTRTVEVARSAADLGPIGPPALPASIWTGIATELGIGADTRPALPPAPPATEVPAQRSPSTGHLPAGDSMGRRERSRRVGAGSSGWRRGLLVAAVVVAAAVGTGAGLAIGHRGGNPPAAVEYQAELTPMPAGPADAHATATVSQANGSQTLKVSARQLPLRQGYYEVWLYNPTADKMVAVGTLGSAGDGAFTLASTIDLRSYSVVDVSAQDFDGNPAHKASMLQGPLTQ